MSKRQYCRTSEFLYNGTVISQYELCVHLQIVAPVDLLLVEEVFYDEHVHLESRPCCRVLKADLVDTHNLAQQRHRVRF